MNKIDALAKYLDVEANEIIEENDTIYSHGRCEYLVLTDDEADLECAASIRESLWAFNADFIAAHSKALSTTDAIKALRKMQETLCEDANALVAKMIDDLDYFIADAIKADGRGHFLSSYDGDEVQCGELYIYRRN